MTHKQSYQQVNILAAQHIYYKVITAYPEYSCMEDMHMEYVKLHIYTYLSLDPL